MLVGEQPGDQEDLQGKPFVGPAGKLLQATLKEGGVDPREVYLTNVVKLSNGNREGNAAFTRNPAPAKLLPARPWLDAEIAALKSKVIVCLGATAAQALLGRAFRVTEHRDELLESSLAPYVMAAVHPSSILRAANKKSRHEQERQFFERPEEAIKL